MLANKVRMINLETKQNEQISDGSELIPAEVAAREKREGSEPPNPPVKASNEEQKTQENPKSTDGYTVDQEGLVNNYPVTPKTYNAQYPTPRQQYFYLLFGGIALIFVTALVLIAVGIS